MSIENQKSNLSPGLKHYIDLDGHNFIGRIYDLSLVTMYFESYAEVSKYDDCKYVVDVNKSLSVLVDRTRSINLAADMVWLEPFPGQFSDLPIGQYDWLLVAQDVFLMRYISVFDCALILANDVFELNQPLKKCVKSRLIKFGIPQNTTKLLEDIELGQESLRNERNARFHHGNEKELGTDDATFRLASLFAKRGSNLSGKDANDEEIDLERYYDDAATEMKTTYNSAVKSLQNDLVKYLDHLELEFESRFKRKFKNSSFPHKSR